MWIEHCHVDAFGHFKDFNLQLGPHLNCIIGNNQSGKTTLADFIDGMFYGLQEPHTRQVRPSSMMKNRRPIHTDQFRGSMKCWFQDHPYRIHHNFMERTFSVFDEESATYLNFPSSDPRQIGQSFFKQSAPLHRDLYHLTFSKRHIKNPMYWNLLDIWMSSFGGKIHTNAIQKLEEQEKDLGSQRSMKKPYGKALQQKEKLEEEIGKLVYENLRLREEYRIVKNKFDRLVVLGNKSFYLDQMKRESDNNRLTMSEFLYLKGLAIETQYAKSALIKEQALLQEEEDLGDAKSMKKNKVIWQILLLMLLFIGVAMLNRSIYWIILIIASCACLIMTLDFSELISNNRQDASKHHNLDEIEAIQTEIERLENEQMEILDHKELHSIEAYEEALSQQKTNQPKINFTFLEKLEFDEDQIPLIKTELFSLQSIPFEMDRLSLEIKAQEISLMRLRGEKERIEKEIQEIEHEKKAIALASSMLKKTFKEASLRNKEKVMGFLNDRMRKISEGYIEKVFLQDPFDFHVRYRGHNYLIAEDQLSSATRDQLHLCFRLALIDFVEAGGEKFPLILDDLLVQYDPDRRFRMAEMIHEEAKERQIILFASTPQPFVGMWGKDAKTKIIQL